MMTALYFYAPIKEVSIGASAIFALLTALLMYLPNSRRVKPTAHTRPAVLVCIRQRS